MVKSHNYLGESEQSLCGTQGGRHIVLGQSGKYD